MRLITLAIFLVIGVVVPYRLPDTSGSQLVLLGGVLGLLYGRFAEEWQWLRHCMCASLHGDELILATEREQRQIPLHSISQRNTAQPVHGAALPQLGRAPGRHSLAALRAAVLAAKVRRQQVG